MHGPINLRFVVFLFMSVKHRLFSKKPWKKSIPLNEESSGRYLNPQNCGESDTMKCCMTCIRIFLFQKIFVQKDSSDLVKLQRERNNIHTMNLGGRFGRNMAVRYTCNRWEDTCRRMQSPWTIYEIGSRWNKTERNGRKLGRRRAETGRNAVGDRIMSTQAQHYIGVCRPIKVIHQTPSCLVCKLAPTDDTLYVPAIVATGIWRHTRLQLFLQTSLYTVL